MAVRDVVQAAAGVGGAKLYVEDVFSTYLYTGTGTTQTITNGIDLAGEGGAIWIKGRSTGTENWNNYDTERGANFALHCNTTDAQQNYVGALTSFNSNGFTVEQSGYAVNNSAVTYTSWTFRKAPKFFDVVTWTGDGVSGRAIPHNLGSTPGCIIIKRTDSSAVWTIFHAGLSGGITGSRILFDTSAATVGSNITAVDDSTFTVISTGVNNSGGTYVAYLFAHNAGGFGDDGLQNVISCGSYTGTGAAGNAVTLGYEPQWLMIKKASGATSTNWFVFDVMRGIATGGNDAALYPNITNAEFLLSALDVTATGFSVQATSDSFNTSGETYIYIAIRRGPMKTPESGTEVFNPALGSSGKGFPATFPIDLNFFGGRTGTDKWYAFDRLTGGSYLYITTTAQQATNASFSFFQNNANYYAFSSPLGTNYIGHSFRRAPGFMDLVAYTGNGVNGADITHNLTVAPEFVIMKKRSSSTNGEWTAAIRKNNGDYVEWIAGAGSAYAAFTNAAAVSTRSAASAASVYTSTYVKVGGSYLGTNDSGSTYIAYLFASCPGVSKVGSYTGTGTTQTIDCGFSSGARFVLIKRTDSTGDWYVWDSVRGIVAGNDPYLFLNSTAAEVTSTDYIDPVASGFEISSSAPAAINASGGSYIFLAIA